MAYSSGSSIQATNRDFNNLRGKVNTLLTNTLRQATGGNADINKYKTNNKYNSTGTTYTTPPDVATTITETAGNTINASPLVNCLNVIEDLLKNKYLKTTATATTTAATNIKNRGKLSAGSQIPALTDYYTVVNEWNSDTTGTSCNGACVGFCSGSCAGGASKVTTTCTGCGTNCTSGCGGGCYNCSSSCKSACSNSCGSDCIHGCSQSCSEGCENGCASNCSTSCGSYCDGCSGGCANGCSGSCHGGCYGACTTACTSGCSGNCTGKCHSTCSGTCMFIASATPT